MQLSSVKLRIVLFAFVVLVISCAPQNKRTKQLNDHLTATLNQNLKDAAAQYKVLMKNIPADKFPKSYQPKTGKHEWSNSEWWCSGFYPGSLLYLYEETKDDTLLIEALRILKILEKEQFNKTTHDLGFMMFCSFGNANRIQPQEEYTNILINSARSLSSRFNAKTGSIKSWDSQPSDFLVIVDNMMNLELLFWATKATGDSSFYKIAVTHADNTIKNHFRSDNSSYHVLNYDVGTGAIKQKKTAQGYSNESAWARGQAWGLYGFVVMYRETKDRVYLQQANKIAQYIINHPNLPADKIPYWDFNAPGIPNELRDASAAAIIASALLELIKYSDKKTSASYTYVAQKILHTLSSDTYKAKTGSNGGFIIQHGVGHMPNKTEIDVPLTYADYYFIEALKRYKSMQNYNEAPFSLGIILKYQLHLLNNQFAVNVAKFIFGTCIDSVVKHKL